MMQVLNRMAVALLAGSLLSACANSQDGEPGMTRPHYPVRAPETPAPSEPAPPQARPTETVEAKPLAPPPGAEASPPRPAPPAAPYRPFPPPAAAPPQVQTVTRTSVAGKVVDAAGPARTHKVDKGDTVYSIARKFDVTPERLAKDNNLGKNFTIRPGQVLKGPSSKAKAYQVAAGDTLYAIARRFSVTPQALADANDMKIDAGLRVGQKVVLPDGYKDKGPTVATVRVPVEAPPARAFTPPPQPAPRPAPRSQPPTYAPAPAPQAPPPRSTPPPAVSPAPAPIRPPEPPPVAAARPTPPAPAAPMPAPAAPRPVPTAPVIIPSAPAATDAQISQLGRGRFVWPLKGAVISEFGPKGTGQRNDGVNIRAVAGEPVRAAAAGDVVYAGDQVPGFGNLVLVKHPDGWVSAYGHLARLDVKMQDKVAQGQQIGQAGASGGVAEPQLHFEIRYAPTPADRARPINPMLVLPK